MRRITVFFLLMSWARVAIAQEIYDFRHQSAVIDITRGHLSIDLSLTMELRALDYELPILVTLVPMVDLTVNGEAVETRQYPGHEGYIETMILPPDVEVGDVLLIEASLRGEPECDDGYFIKCRHSSEETFLFQSAYEAGWHFLNLTESDGFVGETTVIAPEGHSVVAGEGIPESVVENGDGTTTWSYSFDTPTDNMFFYAAQAQRISSEEGFPVTAYFSDPSTDADNVARAVNLASEVIGYYNETFGEIPVEEAHIMIMPPDVSFGGMGLLGNVFLAEYVVGEADYLIDQGIGHEFGHSWWGGIASAVIPNEGSFIQNGLAEYSGLRALGELYGEDLRTSAVRMHAVYYIYRRPGDQDIAVLADEVYRSEVYIHVAYHKGSCVFRTFEGLLGRETYATALRSFLGRGFGGLTVAALLEEIETAGGGDLTDEVDQWLRQPGFPRLRVGAQVSGEAPFVVDVEVESEGSFTYRLPLHFVMTDGSTHEESMTVGVGLSHESFSLDTPPVLVRADPQWTLVREITPALEGDVTFDGVVDAHDLIEVALMSGGELPVERRVDGAYDPLHDVNSDRRINGLDLDSVLAAAAN